MALIGALGIKAGVAAATMAILWVMGGVMGLPVVLQSSGFLVLVMVRVRGFRMEMATAGIPIKL